MRHIGDGSTMPPDRAWHALAHLLGHWELRGYGMWAVTDRATGEVLGRVGLYHPEGWPGTELGWLLDRSRWGRGLATEAATLAATWVWETLEVDRLIPLIQPDNHASIRVAQKLGSSLDHRLALDGTAVDRPLVGGRAHTTPSSTASRSWERQRGRRPICGHGPSGPHRGRHPVAALDPPWV